MRVTRHNSRGLKNSPVGFTAKHNDRNFDTSKADNINPDKSKNNRYWNCYSKQWYWEEIKSQFKSFEQTEQTFYENHFREQYEAVQAKYKASRHYDKLCTFDEWRKQKAHCPEECSVQIGNVDGHAKIKDFYEIGKEYLKAERDYYKKHGIKCAILDCAFHFDEQVGHLQERRVYYYTDIDGRDKVGQNECFKQSDIALPKPHESVSKSNNWKMTVDADLRTILCDICEKHGLTIEREPIKDAKHNRSKEKYVADKERKMQAEAEAADLAEKLLLQKENEILEAAERIKKSRAARQNEDILIADLDLSDEAQEAVKSPVKHGKRYGKHPNGISL